MEEYKIITGYENYEISNLGNVRNKQTLELKKQYNCQGYKSVNLNGKTLRVHRLVGLMFIPNPNNKPVIDHINNIRTDNRVENLRWATSQENNFNSSMNCKNTSGVKGVRFHKRDNRWRAELTYNRKLINIGSFLTKEEAIKARQNKAKELFGEYMNECEKPQIIEIDLNIKKKRNQKIKLNINIEEDDDEYKKLEKEFEELLK